MLRQDIRKGGRPSLLAIKGVATKSVATNGVAAVSVRACRLLAAVSVCACAKGCGASGWRDEAQWQKGRRRPTWQRRSSCCSSACFAPGQTAGMTAWPDQIMHGGMV